MSSRASQWVALLVVGLGGFACADALSITPPGGGGGADTTTTAAGASGGTGGMATVPCLSNSDCPFPTTVCDTARGICVGCLELADCAHMPGTLCSEGTCSCPTVGESWCEPDLCVDLTTDPDHCGACGKTCFGSCIESACADPWVPVGTQGAPEPRGLHVSEWTGTHLFVWGGSTTTNTNDNLNTGGLYDPTTNEWTPTSVVGAPAPRQRATSVWTGTHVIVWGGRNGGTFYNDGAMYDPATNTWTALPVAAAPEPRIEHTAVWTGTSMIVWGGTDDAGDQLNTGGIYDLTAWSATAAVPSPAAMRTRHAAVWADGEMWIYGGFGDSATGPIVNEYFPFGAVTGGLRYDPGSSVWGTLPITAQPTGRDQLSMVYDGTNAIVFGGFNGTDDNNLGARVDDAAIQWETLGGSAPEERRAHTAVWLADTAVMVVFGGRNASGALGSGGVYAAASNAWTTLTPTALVPRDRHTAVSTGTAMIVWGGFDSGNNPLGDGGIYTP